VGVFYVICTRWAISLFNDVVSDLGGMVGLIYRYREFILGFSPFDALFRFFEPGFLVLVRMPFSFSSSKKQLLGVWWSLGDFVCDILRSGVSSQILYGCSRTAPFESYRKFYAISFRSFHWPVRYL